MKPSMKLKSNFHLLVTTTSLLLFASNCFANSLSWDQVQSVKEQFKIEFFGNLNEEQAQNLQVHTIQYLREELDDSTTLVDNDEYVIICHNLKQITTMELPIIFNNVKIFYVLEATNTSHNITIICPNDEKSCVGGDHVKRIPPNCGFEQCPRMIPLVITFFCSLVITAATLTAFGVGYRYFHKRALGGSGYKFNIQSFRKPETIGIPNVVEHQITLDEVNEIKI